MELELHTTTFEHLGPFTMTMARSSRCRWRGVGILTAGLGEDPEQDGNVSYRNAGGCGDRNNKGRYERSELEMEAES